MNDKERAEYWKRREREDELQRMSQTHVCADCGSLLVTPWDAEKNEMFLVCAKDRSHKGFVKAKSWTQSYNDGELVPIFIANKIEKRRIKQMQEKSLAPLTNEEATRALTKAYSKEEAMLLLKTCWPDAPVVEVEKAAILCATYGLNPLLDHVFIIPFWNNEKKRHDYRAVLGIKATRIIAQSVDRYSFVDGPRMLTPQEQEAIIGEVDQANFWAIVVIKDSQDNQAPGYGSWPKAKTDPQTQQDTPNLPYGSDKGNTMQNMAFIRAERNALSKLYPGQIPTNVEVIEGEFVERPEPPALPPKKFKSLERPKEPAPASQTHPSHRMPTNPREYLPPTVADLIGAANRYFGLTNERVSAILEVSDLTQISDLKLAWSVILTNQGIQPKK